MVKKNQDLLDTFSSKFAEYKSELEKAASKRGDDHDTALDNLKKELNSKIENLKKQLRILISNVDTRHNLKYADLNTLTGLLQKDINKANTKIEKNKDELDFVVEKSVKQGESNSTNTQSISTNWEKITEVKNAFLKHETQLARTKGVVDNLSASDVATTKRLDDLAEIVLELKENYNTLEEELETVRREVFLFEYYNSRQLHLSSIS